MEKAVQDAIDELTSNPKLRSFLEIEQRVHALEDLEEIMNREVKLRVEPVIRKALGVRYGPSIKKKDK